MDQQHNEMDQQGSSEGVDSGNGSEFQGQCREGIYLRINWEIDQVKTLKATFRFIVWVFCVHYNMGNRPHNSEKYGRSCGFHRENNEHFQCCIFLHYAPIIPYI